MANAEDDPITYLKQVEYTARRFHDIYFGRLGEMYEAQGGLAWDELSQGHRDAMLYGIEMLVQEGTIKLAGES